MVTHVKKNDFVSFHYFDDLTCIAFGDCGDSLPYLAKVVLKPCAFMYGHNQYKRTTKQCHCVRIARVKANEY